MTSVRRPGPSNRSTAGVLADIAHELSSTSEWMTRVQDALSMLCDAIPTQMVALGVEVGEWTTFYHPELDDPDELEDRLLDHYALLTGAPQGSQVGIASDIGFVSAYEHEAGSFLSLPVIGAGQVAGVLHVCVDQEDAYSPEDVSVLSIAALQIGSYIGNVQAKAEAEARAQEMETLRDEAEHRAAQLESSLASSSDGTVLVDETGKIILMNDFARGLLGDSPEDQISGRVGQFEVRGLDGTRLPPDQTASYRALQGESVRDLRCRFTRPDGVEIILSINGTPVEDAEGRVIGATTVFRDITDSADVERQREELLEREHHIAQMLQEALIPPQIEYDLEGARIAVEYQPALKEAEVGGDFYDVFRLGEGRVGILVGDVAGKGLRAAVQVAAARYAVRSYAYLDSSPGIVMTLVNELLCRDEPSGGALMTAIYLVVNTVDRTLTYASGGHEYPLVRKSDGQIDVLEEGGRALGVYGGATYAEATRAIDPGETLVLVTDGITEARSHGVLFGPEGVVEFLKSHGELSGSQVASGLLEAATAHAGGALQDDAAIVVLEVGAS